MEEAATAETIKARIHESKRPRILLFGAFGNGNLGDDIQAESVESLVTEAVPNASVWSTSVFSGPYPGRPDRRLPCGSIYSNQILNQFDLLLIGGGGLLAHPHEPLGDESWSARLDTPAAFLGVGAGGAFVSSTTRLLRKALLVGARDVSSLSSILELTANAAFLPDPVLVSPIAEPPGWINRETRFNRCWVIRDPIDEHIEAVRRAVSKDDIVIGLEPKVDCLLSPMFPEMKLIENINDFWGRACASKSIITMRYHGLILGMRASIPSYAYRVDKGASLLRMLGLSHNIVGDLQDHIMDDLQDPQRAQRFDELSTQIAELRSLFISHLRSLFDTLAKRGSC